MASDTHRAIEAVWRIEAARLIAGLAGLVRDVGLAEELAQDALVAALEQWPQSGVPRNPGAWLMTVSKRRAIDMIRRNERFERNLAELGHQLDTSEELPEPDEIEDDLLRLVFSACHPALSVEARVALTLRVLGGLNTEEIARAFLVSEATVAQRIVRAKRTLADKKIPFEVPQGAELAGRLSSVLEVIYLIFNEGYSATAGDDWMRPALCEDALRLGRVLTGLMPNESEVHGLVALMEIHASRSAARVGPTGEPILLLDQNRATWDRLLIGRGLTALTRAEELAAHTPTLSTQPTRTPTPPAQPALAPTLPAQPDRTFTPSAQPDRTPTPPAQPDHAPAPTTEAGDVPRPPGQSDRTPTRPTQQDGAHTPPGRQDDAPTTPKQPGNTFGSSTQPRAAPGSPEQWSDASGPDGEPGRLGPYTLQAAIAACHARAYDPADTDWVRIATLYEALAKLSRSPIVELNRAVALSMAYGPAVGLELLDQIVDEPSLKEYHLLPSVRGDLLFKLGRTKEARTEFERAASMTRNAREQALLLDRAAAC